MKTKITILLAFILFAGLSSKAQMQRMSVEDRVKSTMEKLEPLKLNADQQNKTTEVFTNQYNAQTKVMQDARQSGQRPDFSAFQKMNDDRDASLKKIFTDDQFKKFKSEIEPTLMPRRGGRNGRGGGMSRNRG